MKNDSSLLSQPSSFPSEPVSQDRSGPQRWKRQRSTARALIALTIWLLVELLRCGREYADVSQWLSHPFNTMGVAVLIFYSLSHGYLGIRVILDDYVRSQVFRRSLILVLYTLVFGSGLVGLSSLLVIAVHTRF